VKLLLQKFNRILNFKKKLKSTDTTKHTAFLKFPLLDIEMFSPNFWKTWYVLEQRN
jgi:hypothetical protein